MLPVLQCASCKHLIRPAGGIAGYHCAAFPEGIPEPILEAEHDHREPYPGDHGIRYEARQSNVAGRQAMNLNIENSGAIDRLIARLRKLQDPNFTDLMETWKEIIRRDNQRGVLAGLDKSGKDMPAVTYRPINKLNPDKLTREQKLGVTRGKTGRFGGHGPLASGLHNNLTSAEYRRLGGPPLAPRGVFSRVITSLKLESDHPGPGKWLAWGVWDDVVATDGHTKFLKYHFHGLGQKLRDLTGVRPEGVKLARAAAIAKIRDLVRSGGV